MEILSATALQDMGASKRVSCEVPINSLLFVVEVDQGSVYAELDADLVKSTVGMVSLGTVYLREMLKDPSLTVEYREKDGTKVDFVSDMPLDIAAAISTAGKGEGAVNLITNFNATTGKVMVQSITFTVDLTMTLGAIPLDSDQSIDVTLDFALDTTNIKHKISIQGIEMPLRTNRALTVGDLIVPTELKRKNFDIKDARFLAVPAMNDDYAFDELSFTYPNGAKVTRTVAELMGEHLANNDVSITTGYVSTPLSSIFFISDEIVAQAVQVEVKKPNDKKTHIYSLIDVILPGIDPKSVNATNELMYDN